MYAPQGYLTLMEVWNVLGEFTIEWAVQNPTPDEKQSRALAKKLQPVAEYAAEIESRLNGFRTAKGEDGRTAFDNPPDTRTLFRETASKAVALEQLVAGFAPLQNASVLPEGRAAEIVELLKYAESLRQEIASLGHAFEERRKDCLSLIEIAEEMANYVGLVARRPDAHADRCHTITASSRRLWLFHRFFLARKGEMFLCPPNGEPLRFPFSGSPDTWPSEDFPLSTKGQEQEFKKLRYALPQVDSELFVIVTSKVWQDNHPVPSRSSLSPATQSTIGATLDLVKSSPLCWKTSEKELTAQRIAALSGTFAANPSGSDAKKLRILEAAYLAGEIRTKADAIVCLGLSSSAGRNDRAFRRVWDAFVVLHPELKRAGRRPK